eukprot:jgi/Antlo1/244/1915
MSEEADINNTQISEIVRNYRREEKAMRERVLQCEDWRHMCESVNFLRYVPFHEPEHEEPGESTATYDMDIKDDIERIRGILGK